MSKAKRVVNGENPMNARIRIDYSKKIPDVKFRYPDKRTQVKGSMFFNIMFIWIILLFIPYLIYSYTTGYNINGEIYDKSMLQEFSECAALNGVQTLTNYSNVRNNLCIDSFGEENLTIYTLVYLLVLTFLFFGVPLIIYYPFKKKWNKLYPKWQSFISPKKLKIFKKEDVRENLNKEFKWKYYVELPIFSNVICQYKATKDFSKYMKEFEIEEYKFSYLSKKKVKKGKKKIKIRKKNEWIWYARWYFNEKPINGEMEVIFK